MLENSFGKPRLFGCPAQAFGAQGRLVGVLQQDRVARHQRRHDRVDRGEVGEVPGSQHQHQSQGGTLHEPAKARLFGGLHRGKRLRGHGKHAPGTGCKPGDLMGGMGNGAADLPGQLLGRLWPHGHERIHHGCHRCHAVHQGHLAPFCLGLHPSSEAFFDLPPPRQGTLHVHRAIHGAHGVLLGR